MKIHMSGDKAFLWGEWTNREINYLNIDAMTEKLDQLESEGMKLVRIDLAHLEDIDASGARFLNTWLTSLKLRGIAHEIVNAGREQLEQMQAFGGLQAVPYQNPFQRRFLSMNQVKRRKPMKIDEIKQIAQQHHIKLGRMTKSDLVRAIQVAEGNTPCFGSKNSSECGQSDCLWRADCH
jgi:MFS superfamily sulfate permease-like transporter